MGLTTACGAGLCPPGGNRVLREPNGETAPLPQAGVVLGPVRHPVPLLGNVVTASGIGLEGHSGHPRSRREWTSYGTSLQAANSSSMQQSGFWVRWKAGWLGSTEVSFLILRGTPSWTVSSEANGGASYLGPDPEGSGAGLAVINSVGVGRTAEKVGNLVVNREEALGLAG